MYFEVLLVLVDGKLSTPIRSSGEALKKVEKELLKPLRIGVPGCYADPIAEPIDGGLKLTFDVSGTDWEALDQEGPAGAFEQKVTVLARILIPQYFQSPIKAIARKAVVFFVLSF